MNSVLHVYGQKVWHDEVVIAGTRDALASILELLHQALYAPGKEFPKHTFYVNDGEAFRVRIITIHDRPDYAVPYSAPGACEDRGDAIWP